MPNALITGRPWRVIVAFAIPLLIGNVVQQLYQFVDAIVVGRTLGVTALASVGATTSIMFFLIGFAWGLCTGFAIPTARAFGASNHHGVRRSVATGTILVLLCSLLLTVGGPLIVPGALQLLQTPGVLLPGATTFAQTSLLGASALMFFNYLAAIIRAIGDSRTPLVFLVIACALNVALVIVLVGPLGAGIAGAATATVTAQTVSALLCLGYVRKRLPILHVHRADWVVTWPEIRQHLRLGLPTGFQASIIALGSLAVQTRLNSLGPDAVAAYTTAARVDGLAVALLQSLGLAMTIFTAQNLGAGNLDRIRRGVSHGLVVAAVAAIGLGGIVILLGRPLVRLFVGGGDATVVAMSHMGLSANGSLYIILAVLFVLRGTLQGLGRTMVPTATGVAELVMRVITAVGLGAAFSYAGVVWGTPLAWAGAVLLLVPAYLRARRQLIHEPETFAPSNRAGSNSVGDVATGSVSAVRAGDLAEARAETAGFSAVDTSRR